MHSVTPTRADSFEKQFTIIFQSGVVPPLQRQLSACTPCGTVVNIMAEIR